MKAGGHQRTPEEPDVTWMRHAACRREVEAGRMETDDWYPERGEMGSSTTTHPAVAVCERCPVRTPCLEYALAAGLRHGIFGGLPEQQRKRIRRQRRQREGPPPTVSDRWKTAALDVLARGGIYDFDGRATRRLLDAVAMPNAHVPRACVWLGELEADGLIVRERGKRRTYLIALAENAEEAETS